MELTNALRIPLAQSEVWDAMQDLALLRASLDNCESFTRLAGGEYALTLTVPLVDVPRYALAGDQIRNGRDGSSCSASRRNSPSVRSSQAPSAR